MPSKGLVLIVEDEDAIRLSLRDYLSKKNYDVLVASDGVGALKQLLDYDVDLIVSDYRMDVLGGDYWIKFLIKYCSLKRIIITSGFLRPDFDIPFDVVLIDSPCSGSGTWRRQPHLKWVTTPAGVKACARKQLDLLTQFAGSVRPGGRLVYATCSLCRSENEEVLAAFSAAHPGFAPAGWARNFTGMPRGGGLLFRPDGHDGDGYFAASLRRVS